MNKAYSKYSEQEIIKIFQADNYRKRIKLAKMLKVCGGDVLSLRHIYRKRFPELAKEYYIEGRHKRFKYQK